MAPIILLLSPLLLIGRFQEKDAKKEIKL